MNDLVGRVEDNGAEVGQELDLGLPGLLDQKERLQLRLHPFLVEAHGHRADRRLGAHNLTLLPHLDNATKPRDVAQGKETYVWPEGSLGQEMYQTLRKDGAYTGALGVQVRPEILEDLLRTGHWPRPQHDVRLRDELCWVLGDLVQEANLGLAIWKPDLGPQVLEELRAAGQELNLHPALGIAIDQRCAHVAAVPRSHQRHHRTTGTRRG
mmetsp:Transcript_115598/g.274728  ORF Transcript_115598/g.274728 Transcript_115598/m.274728 type:complete len:210 (-) Transcript_115598:120-749(-)